jgi:outer membrane immunogenic protein
MRLLRIVAFATVASICLVGNAAAADMQVKAPVYKAPAAAAAAYDWSGFYIGGDVGWQGSRIDLSDPTSGVLTYAPHHDSLALGGFVGIQHQFGHIVLGIEGGYIAAFNDASLGATTSVPIFFLGGTGTAQAKLKDIWSIGGRAGWAIGRWMPYITGGYGNGSFEFNAQDTPPSFVPAAEQAKARTDGAYIGAGVDWAVTNNWILGIEYRHYSFAAKTVTGAGTNFAGLAFTEPVRFDTSTDSVMARLSYKFDWP